MAIPDNTYFGPDGITFGTIRETKDPTKRIELLKKRLDSFFVGQIDVLDNRSPFPKAIMTCIAIETLGRIFYKPSGDSLSFQFIQVIGKVDQRFGRPLSKKFKERLTKSWPNKEAGQLKSTADVKTVAELIYTFFRNTMMHGYRARAVYLSDKEEVELEEGDGYLVLNPHWFWTKFKLAYDSLIQEALNETRDSSYRKQCLVYIQIMLSESDSPDNQMQTEDPDQS